MQRAQRGGVQRARLVFIQCDQDAAPALKLLGQTILPCDEPREGIEGLDHVGFLDQVVGFEGNAVQRDQHRAGLRPGLGRRAGWRNGCDHDRSPLGARGQAQAHPRLAKAQRDGDRRHQKAKGERRQRQRDRGVQPAWHLKPGEDVSSIRDQFNLT